MNPILEEVEAYVQHPLATRLVTLGLSLLSSRSLVWVTTIGAGSLWTLTMLDPSPIKIATATGFCLTVLLPILYRDAKSG